LIVCVQIPKARLMKMTTNEIKWNGEIWRKILNSVAGKYDCGVRFTIEGGRLAYEGDRDCAVEIIKETRAMIGSAGQ
jgi:hypothetical protein